MQKGKFAMLGQHYIDKCVPVQMPMPKAFPRFIGEHTMPLEYNWWYPKYIPFPETRTLRQCQQRKLDMASLQRMVRWIELSRKCHVPTVVTWDERGEWDDEFSIGIRGENAACRQFMIDFIRMFKGQLFKDATLDYTFAEEEVGPYSLITWAVLDGFNTEMMSRKSLMTMLVHMARCKTVAYATYLPLQDFLATGMVEGTMDYVRRALPQFKYHRTDIYRRFCLNEKSQFTF